MYEHRTAYRHEDGSVEGFLGQGLTKNRSIGDAIEQMKRKCDIVVAENAESECGGFSKDRVVSVLSSLKPGEIAGVQRDWKSGLRY